MSMPLPEEESKRFCLDVNPGACGFTCSIVAVRNGKKEVEVSIKGSECRQILRFSEKIRFLTMKDLFMPLTKNPVYRAAEESGCHASCTIPVSVLKVSEAAMGMAVAKDVNLKYKDCKNAA